MKYIDLRISASCDEDLVSFLKLCGIIQGAGEKGAGTNIKVFVDGDGSGRYRFENLSDGQRLPSLEECSETLWLGE